MYQLNVSYSVGANPRDRRVDLRLHSSLPPPYRVKRFDRLLLALKTIVGEEFHLEHLDLDTMERYAS